MRSAITNRISRRTFTKEHLSKPQIETITSLIKSVNEKSGLTIEFAEDGSAAFASVRITYGMFKNVRSMLLLKGNPDMPDFKEKIGYYGEELVLDLVDMGLGTCWVGGTFDREAFQVSDGEYIPDVILVGSVDRPTFKDKIMIRNAHQKRKPLEQRISSDQELPGWVRSGMEAVIPAPSAVNKQKPHFDYKNGVLTASVPDDYQADLTDLGIAKFHFEAGAENGRFLFGNGARYVLN